MVFECQRNSYITEYKTKVVSVSKCATDDMGPDCYELIFEDTIFFPEGGGQPYDTGIVNDVPVTKVLRRKGTAIHYVNSELEVGSEVNQKINWDRRFDHMQQHTGQHLITAIAYSNYGFDTTSWNLGKKISYIELNVDKINENELASLEEDVNTKIRLGLEINVKEYDSNDPMLKQAKTRGLPKDVTGPVRVVSIDGIDANICCGTHLKNVCELQSIKMLYVEKGKANKTKLYFVAGKRLLSYFEECICREKELNRLLHSNPSDHGRLVSKLQANLKQNQNILRDTWKDLAKTEACLIHNPLTLGLFYSHHKKHADSFYLYCLISEINELSSEHKNMFKMLTAGGDRGDGILILDGQTSHLKKLSEGVCHILGGKGNYNNNIFTAKISKIELRDDATLYIGACLPALLKECSDVPSTSLPLKEGL